MTKEEQLKQEAEEYAEGMAKYYASTHEDCIPSQFEKYLRNAYISSAEPREKQITGLSKHILELQKDKGNLIDKCKELEAQNNWLEGCKLELGEHLGKANDRIAELEKRCANYEMTISKMEKGTCDICKEIEKDKKIEELEQKLEQIKNEKFEKALSQIKHDREVVIEYNERLQKENTELKDCFKIAKDNEYEYQSLFTKAKDHIKKLLDCLKQDTNDPQTNYYVCQYMDKAEQFLKDSEKEC